MLVCQSKYQTEVLDIFSETTRVYRNGDSQMHNVVYTLQLHVSAKSKQSKHVAVMREIYVVHLNDCLHVYII
jgi:hypothetical protein